MTGWRIGWLECPRALVQTAENLIQYSSSGVPTFLQRGAIAAIDHGTSFVDHQIQRARKGLEITTQAFSNLSNIEFMTPEGAFYLYFKISTSRSSMDIAKDLIDRANVGLAPGTAFSKSTDAWLRLCFLRKEDDLHEAMNRLTKALSA